MDRHVAYGVRALHRRARRCAGAAPPPAPATTPWGGSRWCRALELGRRRACANAPQSGPWVGRLGSVDVRDPNGAARGVACRFHTGSAAPRCVLLGFIGATAVAIRPPRDTFSWGNIMDVHHGAILDTYALPVHAHSYSETYRYSNCYMIV